MTKAKHTLLLATLTLALASACGPKPKPTRVNDEVSVPMDALDEEALDEGDDSAASGAPALDAGI